MLIPVQKAFPQGCKIWACMPLTIFVGCKRCTQFTTATHSWLSMLDRYHQPFIEPWGPVFTVLHTVAF